MPPTPTGVWRSRARSTPCCSNCAPRGATSRRGGRLPEYTLGFCYLSDRFAADCRGDRRRVAAPPARGALGRHRRHWSRCDRRRALRRTGARVDARAPAAARLPRLLGGAAAARGRRGLSSPHRVGPRRRAHCPTCRSCCPSSPSASRAATCSAGSSASRGRSVQIADGVFDGGGLSGVAFSAEVGVVSRVTQGCQPIGPRRLVSRAQDNFVITLDGRGALDCVMEDLGLPPDMALEPVAEALSNTLVGPAPERRRRARRPRRLRRRHAGAQHHRP